MVATTIVITPAVALLAAVDDVDAIDDANGQKMARLKSKIKGLTNNIGAMWPAVG